MVAKGRNTLVRPYLWEDPHEMNYSNSVIVTDEGDIPLDVSHWFGQCWSKCEESAIMWQAFKKEKDPYVKIKVEAFNLIKGFNLKGNNLRIAVLDNIRYFSPIANEDYQNKTKDIYLWHQWLHNFIKFGVTLAELYPVYNLLTKRNVFKHEEEVRLLLFDKSSSENQESISYPFNLDIIKEVVIDPWTSLDDNKYKRIERKLRKYLIEDKTVIRKSEIFSDCSKFSVRYHIK